MSTPTITAANVTSVTATSITIDLSGTNFPSSNISNQALPGTGSTVFFSTFSPTPQTGGYYDYLYTNATAARVVIKFLDINTTYTITLQIKNGGSYSSPITVTGTTAMNRPLNINYTATSNSLTFTWSAVLNAQRYDVYLYTPDRTTQVSGSPIQNIVSPLSATFNGLSANTTYYVTIIAKSDSNTSEPSSRDATTNAAAPVPPSAPTMNPVTNITSTGATLSWTAPAGTILYYKLYLNGSNTADVSSNAATYIYTTLSPNTPYSITVSAVGAGGESSKSSAAVFTTAKKTFTATYASKTSTSIVFDISSAEGVPATITSSGTNYNVTGGKITITGLSPNTAYTFTLTATDYNDVVTSSITTLASETPAIVPCFFGNAPVLTAAGYRRMDSLRAGDKVMTPEGGEATIERVKVTRCAAGPQTNPFVIPQGHFGAIRRVLISPNHKVVTSRGLVEAKDLGLQQEERTGELTYYNLELTDQAHMVVGGVAVESLAPVRRLVMTLDQFKAAIAQKYGGFTPAVLANIQRTCRFLADGRVEVPILHR